MTLYPKLNKKLGLIGAICLIVWGVFILGMQLYVFGYYSRVYGEGTGDNGWGSAYSGMGLANSAACLFFGIFYVIVFTEQATTKMLLWAMILTVVGAGAAAASTVLAALEADWLNTDSQHPCNNASDTDASFPTPLICTNWLALEVTVSVLSGLAFSEYIFIGWVVFRGLSAGKHADHDDHHPERHHPPAPADKMEPQPPVLRVNTINPQMKGHQDGPPYSAYNNNNNNQPSKERSPDLNSYDDLNPQYSYHLQQLSMQQQQMAQQTGKQSPKTSPALQYRPPQHQLAPPAPLHNQISRGRLQVLHNQRQRAPPPPVPSKPTVNSSNLYRY